MQKEVTLVKIDELTFAKPNELIVETQSLYLLDSESSKLYKLVQESSQTMEFATCSEKESFKVKKARLVSVIDGMILTLSPNEVEIICEQSFEIREQQFIKMPN